jgi:hypothetical protein
MNIYNNPTASMMMMIRTLQHSILPTSDIIYILGTYRVNGISYGSGFSQQCFFEVNFDITGQQGLMGRTSTIML